MHCCVSSQSLGFTGGKQNCLTEEASDVESVSFVMSSEPKSVNFESIVKRLSLLERL